MRLIFASPFRKNRKVPKAVRVSLAHKCQLLFGAAVVLILTAALAVVWVRMQVLVREGHKEAARRLATGWLSGKIEQGRSIDSLETLSSPESPEQGLILTLIRKDEFELAASRDVFLDKAIERFQLRNDLNEYFDENQGQPFYRYARAIRKSDMTKSQSGLPISYRPSLETPSLADPVQMVLSLQVRADQTEQQLALNRVYIVAAGLVAGLLAIGVFWFITMRIVLSPVRVLRDTAQKISEGDLNIRSDINTGDEFEQLSDTFNHMVETLRSSQEQLAGVNKTLDLKLVELSRVNVALHETNKIKNEFLANVSHELRTPLNSIVGFAEVLEETLRDRTGPVDEKRKRYIANIITSSRRLLDLINELLDLAKIEAGRMDIHPGPMSVADTLEGLSSLMRPQAEKRNIQLQLQVEPNLPVIVTDAGKFQQILFNFLSNAIKFTPEGGNVMLEAALLAGLPSGTGVGGTEQVRTTTTGQGGGSVVVEGGGTPGASNGGSGGAGTAAKLIVSVIDTGPGIAAEMHEKIFEKFTQLDSAVTREHGGSGLGLAISRELAKLLQGRIELMSNVGQGAKFSLIIPLQLEEDKSASLMPQTTT